MPLTCLRRSTIDAAKANKRLIWPNSDSRHDDLIGGIVERAVLISFASPASPDEESDFNNWYEQTHVDQVRAAIPEITQVTRYRQVLDDDGSGSNRYITVFQMDIADVGLAADALRSARESGALDQTATIDREVNPPVLVWAELLSQS